MKAIIFDMDGTLANIDLRRKYLEGDKKDWESFHNNLDLDEPNSDICNLARMYGRYYRIIICSGRFEKARAATIAQLEKWQVKYELILLRPDGDYKDDDKVKFNMLTELKSLKYDPVIAVDDRDNVVKMWRDNGLRCLQVAEGDF